MIKIFFLSDVIHVQAVERTFLKELLLSTALLSNISLLKLMVDLREREREREREGEREREREREREKERKKERKKGRVQDKLTMKRAESLPFSRCCAQLASLKFHWLVFRL